MHAALLLLTLAKPAALDPNFVELFTPLEYRYTGGRYHDELFRYRLFVPRVTSSAAKQSLIVWLHGYGEYGRDNAYQLRWLDELIICHADHPERYPFFLLAVQCPPDNAGWMHHQSDDGPDGMVDVMAAILDQVLRDHPIDPDRVYLSGVSDGGNGCWTLAIEQPQYFAAVAPLASVGANMSRIERLGDIPVWVFHSRDDLGTPLHYVQRTVADLKEAGGSIALTEIASDQHDCWTAAFRDYGLLDWLLAQRRGVVGPPPGNASMPARAAAILKDWTWPQILIQTAVVLALLGATYTIVKKLRKPTAASQAPR